jgi:hypothetical protein
MCYLHKSVRVLMMGKGRHWKMEMLIIQLYRILLPVEHDAYNQCENVSSGLIHYIIQ